jgi:Protein of unknown function (DUF3305)
MDASTEEITVGVVVERHVVDHPWRKWRWRAVEIVPGLPGGPGWRLLVRADGWARYAAAGVMLQLHRKETEDYQYALSARPAQLYVVLRAGDTTPVPFQPFLVTASPWEAQAYQEPGDDQVDAVPMPPAVAAWVEAFVARHHVEQPFFKRRRKGTDKAAGEGSDFVRLDEGKADDRTG